MSNSSSGLEFLRPDAVYTQYIAWKEGLIMACRGKDSHDEDMNECPLLKLRRMEAHYRLAG
jgi:hypothetical protein